MTIRNLVARGSQERGSSVTFNNTNGAPITINWTAPGRLRSVTVEGKGSSGTPGQQVSGGAGAVGGSGQPGIGNPGGGGGWGGRENKSEI